ncbi:hydantoinase B/oxoprolinase family protein [Fictibacillus sp. WQ 8-8]|uniref:hydantoinase B/oxoprolinase family protein n=1 Tax=Fictibacillus sp. WQ 8-8 TaxID=2938788 RepID=UPI00210B2C39|nr:hydantoinase B/oxoprolinase family protein [Fictibacillus sp. WQ 8-8]MCQ6267345.1 hydantoinase B/oxoprolinase family protein [Fictibacillus sp. WQ 8-8]
MTTIKTDTVKRQLDPITFEVLRRSFEYTCERMSLVLQKASFSPIIYDMVDYSNAIFDPDVNLIGQTANCPVHIAAMHFSARASLKRYPIEELGPDDVIILNDPYDGGTHTPDVTMTMPVFYDGILLGFAVSRAHWTDVGGGFDTHIAGEGLRLPPLMLYKEGKPNTELIEIIKNSTRTPQYIEGDIQAQLGALRAARDEFMRLADKYGTDVLRQGMREVLDYTQEMTKEAINRIPDGEYEASDYIDSDGFTDNPVQLRVKITVAGDRIGVDFTGSDPIAIGPINSPYANTASAVYYSLKFFLNPEAPANAGMYRQIDLTIPENTWLNPHWPSPTLGCTTVASSKITAAIWMALAKAIPERIVAPTCSDANWYVASAADPATGDLHIFTDLPAGGWGGTPTHDGMHVTMDPLGNCQNLPAEIAELLFPIRYNSFEMRTDSAGAGRYRGGVGVHVEVEFLGRGEMIWMECSRTRKGSPGVNGGLHSAQQRQLRKTRQGELETIGGLADDGTWHPQMLGGIQFQPGESFVFESTGGGGWGDPLSRDPELVAQDVREEIVSRAQASNLYGVVLTDDLKLDQVATRAKRTEARNKQ